MKIIQKFADCKKWFLKSFSEHPGVWLLLGVLIFATNSNHETSSDLSKICDLIAEDDIDICMDGNCDLIAPDKVKTKHPKTIKQEIEDICEKHEPPDDDR